MIQPLSLVSTKGHKTLSTHRPPKPRSTLRRKKEKVVEESSEPRKSFKIKPKPPQHAPISFMVYFITSTKVEQYQINETQNLSLVEFVKKIIEGDDKKADTFADTIMLSQENLGTRDPNAPTRYLYNKDLFFPKNENTKARMYVLSLHMIHETFFLEDDLEEVLKRWVVMKLDKDDAVKVDGEAATLSTKLRPCFLEILTSKDEDIDGLLAIQTSHDTIAPASSYVS
nr:hypothetical protein [Tanacetum cinerariifolium]